MDASRSKPNAAPDPLPLIADDPELVFKEDHFALDSVPNRIPKPEHNTQQQRVMLKDRVIESTDPCESSWMQSLIRDRLHPTEEGTNRTHNAIKTQLENAHIAIHDIIARYPDMENDDLLCLQELANELPTIKSLDRFTVFGLKFALMTTFIHQKYHSGMPDDYYGLNFRKGTTCRKLAELNYDSMLPGRAQGNNERKPLLVELTQYAREEAFFKNPFSQSTHGTFNQKLYTCIRELRDLLNMGRKRELALLPVFTPVSVAFTVESVPHSLHTLSLSPEPFTSHGKISLSPSLQFLVEAHFAYQLEHNKYRGFSRCQPFEANRAELMKRFCERYRETDREYWRCLQFTLHYLLTVKQFTYTALIEDPELVLSDIFENRAALNSILTIRAMCTLQAFFEFLKEQETHGSDNPEETMARFQLSTPQKDLDLKAKELFAWRQLAQDKNPEIADILNKSTLAKLLRDSKTQDMGFTMLVSYTYEHERKAFLDQIKEKLKKKKMRKQDLPVEFRQLYKF